MNTNKKNRLSVLISVLCSFSLCVLLFLKSREQPTTTPNVTIESIDTFNASIRTGVNNQVIEVFAKTAGFDFQGMTAAVDNMPAQILRGFEQDSFLVRLPRLDAQGDKTLSISLGSGIAPISTTIVCKPRGDSWVLVDYSDQMNPGRVMCFRTDAAGVEHPCRQLLPANGQDNRGFAPGASSECFWIAGQESTGLIRIFYANAATNMINTVMVTTGGTAAEDTSGYVNSIASLRDGSMAVIDWVDMVNSRGDGAGVHWLTVLRIDANGMPSVIKEIPLNKPGMRAVNVITTKIRTAELKIQQGTTVGGGIKQDWAVLASLSAPYKLYLVPLESAGSDYVSYDLAVKPEALELVEDHVNHVLLMAAMGQTGSGVAMQLFGASNSFPAVPGEPVAISDEGESVLGASVSVDNDGSLLVVPIVRNASGYNIHRVLRKKTQDGSVNKDAKLPTQNFPADKVVRQVVAAPANARCVVAAAGSEGCEMYIVGTDLKTVRQISSRGQFNGLVVTDYAAYLDIRNQDKVVGVGLSGSNEQSDRPLPSFVQPRYGDLMVTSRTLAR